MGMLENILVKMDKFIFLVDFILLDIEEDRKVPLVIERSLLAIGRALIDVEKGKLELCIQEEKVTFKVFEASTPLFKSQLLLLSECSGSLFEHLKSRITSYSSLETSSDEDHSKE